MDLKTKLPNPNASRKQRVTGRIMTAVERVRVDSETNLRDILDKVDEISINHVDDTHFFTLSQVYEDLLLKMGEKNSDGGQFFTPREVIRAMVHTLGPKLGDTIYDPCCGTGGFLAIAYEHIARNLGHAPASTDLDTLKHDTFFGREKENLVFPIALANLVLHGVDQPNLWHGNTLTKRASYSALFDKAPKTFNMILTNPPFGGKEGKDAQKNYAYATSSTQVLFVQDILGELAFGGRCGIVLDDGFLFRKDDDAGLPAILTETWTEDENSKGDFPSYARLLPKRGTKAGESRYSWTVNFAARRKQAREDRKPHTDEAARLKAEVVSLKEKLKVLKAANPKDKKIEALQTKIGEHEKAAREAQSKADAIAAAVFDLKAVNPNAIVKIDTRTPEEVIQSIDDQGRIVAKALETLRGLLHNDG